MMMMTMTMMMMTIAVLTRSYEDFYCSRCYDCAGLHNHCVWAWLLLTPLLLYCDHQIVKLRSLKVFGCPAMVPCFDKIFTEFHTPQQASTSTVLITFLIMVVDYPILNSNTTPS